MTINPTAWLQYHDERSPFKVACVREPEDNRRLSMRRLVWSIGTRLDICQAEARLDFTRQQRIQQAFSSLEDRAEEQLNHSVWRHCLSTRSCVELLQVSFFPVKTIDVYFIIKFLFTETTFCFQTQISLKAKSAAIS